MKKNYSVVPFILLTFFFVSNAQTNQEDYDKLKESRRIELESLQQKRRLELDALTEKRKTEFESLQQKRKAKFENLQKKREEEFYALLQKRWQYFQQIPDVSLPSSPDSLKKKTVEISKIKEGDNPNVEIINSLLKEGVSEEQSVNIALEIIDSLGIDAIKEGQSIGIAVEEKNTKKPVVVNYNITPTKVLTLLKSKISGYKYVEDKDSRDLNKYKIPKNSKYKFPLDMHRKTSGFGMREHPLLKRVKKHEGVDYAAPKGTNVYAIADGTVIESSFTKSNGNYVVIKHIDGMESYYLHLNKKGLRKGSWVKIGQVIGEVGNTGLSTGYHLHLGIKKNGKWIDPELLFK